MEAKVNSIDDPRIPLRRVDTRTLEYAQLYDSIRLNDVKQPILVRRKGDGFEVIDGLTRLTISRKLGKATIPIQIEENCSDERAMFLSIQLNSQRIDTKPTEYCQQIQRLLNVGFSMTELCGALSKSITWVRQILSLNKLVPEAQQLVDADKISLRTACDLSRIQRTKQWSFLDRAKRLKPQQFRILVDEHVRQTTMAASQGRLIEQYEVLRPRAVVRSMKVMLQELNNREVAAKLFAGGQIKSPADFAAGVQWCLSMDTETQESMRREFEKAANPPFKKERRRKPKE